MTPNETPVAETTGSDEETMPTAKAGLSTPVMTWASATAATVGPTLSAAMVFTEITSDKHRAQIEEIRTLVDIGGADAEIAKLKKLLPAVTVSGVFNKRSADGLVDYNGLICADVDDIGREAAERLRTKLKGDPFCHGAAVSPSGTGVKAFFRCYDDPAKHLEGILLVQAHMKARHGVDDDPHCKDLPRLCFITYDPEAFWRDDAMRLTPGDVPEIVTAQVVRQPVALATATPEIVVLPSGDVTISESARKLFERITPSRTMFWRGGALVELVQNNGICELDLVKVDGFRTRAERVALLMKWGLLDGKPFLRSSKMSRDDASAIMASLDARELLPPVASVLRSPALIEQGEQLVTLGRGYHREHGGIIIVDGQSPPRVDVREAVASLKSLVEEFHFQTPGDQSRALASFITPALRVGGFLLDNVPVDVAEADQSQAGKGYRHHLVCALYNESAYFVTAKTGGVGSVDESFASALISGRPFVCLDNFRGRMDSQNLEAFLTAPGMFPARVPHKGEVLVDPKRFLLQMSSNGIEATRDLINRASICRIRKRPGFQYRDTLADLKARQPYFLGCVFAIIGEWFASGKPRTADTRHDFRQWAQTLDWIVQNILGCAPLMDGHQDAQSRACNPALSWLRSMAFAVERSNLLAQGLTASELSELCAEHDIEVPGIREPDEDRIRKQIGMLMRRCFKDADSLSVDDFAVSRGQREYRKPSGDMASMNEYTFTK